MRWVVFIYVGVNEVEESLELVCDQLDEAYRSSTTEIADGFKDTAAQETSEHVV